MDAPKSKLEEIFLAAVEKPTTEERTAYLDAACAGDQELRRRVEKLLSAQATVGNFLEGIAPELVATVMQPTPTEGIGAFIGPYKLLEQIGEGGFGIVYMADQQTPVRRRVALKIIKPGMDTQRVLVRFKAELEALSMMDHANIARALDAGATDSGRPYFVMELVRGIPITDYCDQNRLTVGERLELFVQVCRAVQHAHQKGIIHRDIKPSNILVTLHDGTPVPKVIDFGVAKAIDRQLIQETLFTQFAEMIGTPLYMSPEQAEMSGLDIDTRADIYSLGVVLYELLTGSTPFDKERMQRAAFDEIRRIIREDEPPKPSTRISTLGHTRSAVAAHRHSEPNRLSQLMRGDLDWIVMKALEKDRTRRYETANGLAMDVQRYLADEPVEACPPSRRHRLRKFARRHIGAVLSASVVLLTLVLGIIGTTWQMWRATDAEVEAVRAKDRAQAAFADKVAALAAAQKSERTKSEQLWRALVAQARATRLGRRPGQRFQSLESLKQATELAQTLALPAANFQELRNAAIAALAVPDLYLAGAQGSSGYAAPWLDFDGTLALYARTDAAGNCSVRRVADDAVVYDLPGSGLPAFSELSRDGKFVAVNERSRDLNVGKDVHVWQLEGPKPREVVHERKAGSTCFRGSQEVAIGYNDGSIGLFELPSGRRLSRLATRARRLVGFAFHPSERLLAVSCYFEPILELWDLRTGKVLVSAPQSDRPLSVGWHPSGRTLAVGYSTGQIRVCEGRTLEVCRTLEAEMSADLIRFDPRGERMAVRGWGNILSFFDVGTGEKLMTTESSASRPVACRFSGDGLRLAGCVQEGKRAMWQIAGGREFRRLVRRKPSGKVPQLYPAAIHPDGRLLVVGMKDGFEFWDLVTGLELGFIPSGRDENHALFSPSGDLLTLSSTGLSRWPITKGLDATGELSIGPPEPLPLPYGCQIAQSRDGRVIATCDRTAARQLPYAGAWILHAERPNDPIHIDAGADIFWLAVSPDGRWIVTAVLGTGLAKIWDARDGRFVKQLAERDAACPSFSPDGRWLSTSLDGGRLLDVETWKPGPRLGMPPVVHSGAVFASDSKLAAVASAAGMRLLEVATGREVAVLEPPNRESIADAAFTPDGTKLVTLSFANGIDVWNLRLIRRQLKGLGLDWDWPEFAPAAPERPIAEPVKVEIDLGKKWVSAPPDAPPEKSPAKPQRELGPT
jgi:serine/threonine protein kinase/WD40 repeat protein